MNNIILTSNKKIPQYQCSECGKCNSILGTSLCSRHDRGCCWYFPKFTLYEIHKMVKSKDGLAILERILNLPKIEIYNYYLHAVGYFDKVSYDKFMASQECKNYHINDKTIFFRECPFVKEKSGCTIDAQYRSYICNFFICDEVFERIKSSPDYDTYLKERENFIKWIDWENTSLQMMFEEKRLTLINNMNEIIEILKEMPLETYEFPDLNPINENKIIKI